MRRVIKSIILLTICCIVHGYSLCPPDSLSIADSIKKNDSTFEETAVGSSGSEALEDDFQKGLNSLFENAPFDVDTFGWNTTKINAGHFNSETWSDTVRIPLVDTAEDHWYVHPFPNCVTSDFGQRDWFWHFGIDIRLHKKDSVRAAFDGIVRVIQNDRHGYGRVVVIRHGSGLETLYGHLCKELVLPNQEVQAGQVIGLGGNTGRSTGSHLHFETRFFGEPFDPNRLIDFENYELKSDTLVLTKADFAYLVDIRKAQWHVIRRGENLGRIARWYHTSISKICMLNHLSGRSLLKVGRKILVREAPPHGDPSISLSAEKNIKG
jgi:hypothetical protein